MASIVIYQVEDIEKCDYAFRSWETAKDKFNMDDYKEVAMFEYKKDLETDELLERIFILGNNGTLQKDFIMHSISVSDIIEIDGKKYYTDSFGFQEVQL